MLVFRTARPIAALRLGDDISGLTAGSGKDGAGEADLLNDGDEPKEDRRLPVERYHREIRKRVPLLARIRKA